MNTKLCVVSAVLSFGIALPTVRALSPLSGHDGQPIQPPARACAGATAVVHDTEPVCNCTGAPAEVEVCHSQSVTIQVGGSPLTVSTGQSSSSCVSQQVDHGGCLAWRYIFDCCYNWWTGWKCTLRESQARSATSDCGV